MDVINFCNNVHMLILSIYAQIASPVSAHAKLSVKRYSV